MRLPLYAVVLSWNNYTDTRDCIESLKKSSYPLARIILVDNGSQDGSINQLQKDYARDAQIHIIRNECNYGFARGVNVGIRYALNHGAEFIFLVNNDTIVEKTCIERLYAAIEGAHHVGVAGPRIFYYKDPKRVWLGGGYFSKIKTGVIVPEKNKKVVDCDEEIREVTFLTGCAMLIKREVFQRIGFFDENFFLYEEDLDFCLRARREGFSLLYVPSAKVWHKIENIAKDRTSPFTLYHMARSRIINLRKNFSWPYFLYGFTIHLLFYTPFRFLQSFRSSPSLTLKSTKAWLHGTWAGVWQPLQPKSDGGDS